MTSFAAPTGAPGDSTATSFADPNAASSAPTVMAADDKTVVLELGGRQYTLADVVTKITAADHHIATLTEERKQDRELLARVNKVLEKQTSIEDVLGAMKPASAAAAAAPAAAAAAPAAPVAQLTPEQIAATVKSQLQQERVEATETTNWNRVTSTLTSAFGPEKVDSIVIAKAGEHGLDLDGAIALAKRSPDLFLKMFDLAKPRNTPRLTGDVNPVNFRDHAAGQKPSGYIGAKNTRDQVAAYTSAMERKLAAAGR